MPTSKTELLKQLLPGVEAWVALGVVFGLLGLLIFWVRAHWREDADGDASVHEMLTQFRESHREGVLTEEEYRLIKSRLVQRIKPTTVPDRHEFADGTGTPGTSPELPESADKSAKGLAASPDAAPSGGEGHIDVEHPG